MSISPLALAAKKTIDAAWLHGDAYDLSSQAAFALEASRLLRDPEAELTVYRASHGSIVIERYTTPEAAREHCEALMLRESPHAALDWIEDDEDGVAELAATIDGDEMATGYVVTALTIAAAYDEQADE
ncbi:hypothetical protein ACRJ4B_49945 [Streptomyces sp. GTA36]